MTTTAFNIHNIRGQSLLLRCLEMGFVTTAPACGGCGLVVKDNQWAFRQHQQAKRCQKALRLP